MNTKPFESWKVVLNCAICGACPAVEVNAENVTIGEDNNTVRLRRAILQVELGTAALSIALDDRADRIQARLARRTLGERTKLTPQRCELRNSLLDARKVAFDHLRHTRAGFGACSARRQDFAHLLK